MKRRITVDPKTYDLAAYFMSDLARTMTASDDYTYALAEEIQTVCEDFMRRIESEK